MTLTNQAGKLVVQAITDNPTYLALLTAAPASIENANSDGVIAVEASMTGYARLPISGWAQDPVKPLSYISSGMSTASPLSGTMQVIEYFALVENASGPTGFIYAVGQLNTPIVPAENAYLTVAPGALVVGVGDASTIPTIDSDLFQESFTNFF